MEEKNQENQINLRDLLESTLKANEGMPDYDAMTDDEFAKLPDARDSYSKYVEPGDHDVDAYDNLDMWADENLDKIFNDIGMFVDMLEEEGHNKQVVIEWIKDKIETFLGGPGV